MQKLKFQYSKKRKGYYTFLCGCGNTTILRGDTPATACQEEGCTITKLRKHGKSHTRIYNIWSGMRDRCLGNHKACKSYKDRGISICSEWDEFVVFERWALCNGYTENLTIDRKQINGNYSPDNCEWVTRAENTLRQYLDGHSNAMRVLLNGELIFPSIRKAAEYISKFTTTKPKCIAAALERRIKNSNIKPYKGFVITQSGKGG